MVYNLLKHHGIECPHEIDLNSICLSFRVEVKYWNLTFYHPTKPGWHIKLSPEVQREKISHEIRYLILHLGIQPKPPESFITSQDIQTNQFVEHLLVPYLYRFANKISIYDAPIITVNLYKVSEQFTLKRFDRFLNRMFIQSFTHYI